MDTANELHLPVGRTVNLILHSNDVIHSFWIPALGGKRNAIPGRTNFIPLIQLQADFDAWLTAEQQPGLQPTATDADEGAQFFQTSTCQACHTVNGTSAQGKIEPNLTHFASRGTFAGSIFENNADNIRLWLKDPPALKPGSLMPNYHLTDHQLDVLVAYLQALQ